MQHVLCWAKWITAVASIMASPIVLMLAVPLLIGIGVDVAGLRAERLLVLLLWGPTGLVLLRRVARRMPSGLPAAA